MPKRDTPPQADGRQSDPFETTGAFAVPPRPGADHGRPQDDQPFETTGAFARPQSWDDVPDSTQTLNRLPDEGRDPGYGPADPHSAFRPPQHDPFAQGDPGFRQDDRFGDPGARSDNQYGTPGFPQDDRFGEPGFRQGDPFGGGEARDGFGPPQTDPFGQADAHAAFRAPQEDPFGGDTRGFPGEQADPFEQEATGRFDPPGLPPEPGDVKVAGEPTMVARTPAWAEAETGFLDSGWSGDGQGDPEPRRGRGRRKPPKDPDKLDAPSGGRGRLALLSVAAVAVVLGGTVAGVKMLGSGGEEGCPGGRCAAVQGSGQPGPQVSDPVEDEEPEPVEDEEAPADDATEETRPEPTRSNTYSPAPRRTTSPTPKPTRTKSKAPAEDEQIDEPAVDEITEDEVTEEPTDEESTLDDVGNGTVPTQGVPQPTATPTSETASQSRPLSGGAAAVNVRFNVERQQLAGYTATMSVTNDSAQTLNSFTLSMPVRGKVLKVEGVEWTQDGNLLIVDISTPIATGDTAELTISAKGRAGMPKSCGLVGGECAVT
ncbi:hypothetical protein [Nonomuraea sp. NPDC048826]|uniref:hypothetical protein n=1 Tax=Nonomuraea sp. NPDC048826 TaxID=3364347 RepID=UPI00371DE23D